MKISYSGENGILLEKFRNETNIKIETKGMGIWRRIFLSRDRARDPYEYF